LARSAKTERALPTTPALKSPTPAGIFKNLIQHPAALAQIVRMTTRRPPFWFFIDAMTWLRMIASFWSFEMASRIAFARAKICHGKSHLLGFDLPWLSNLLAAAEADLAWALARRASTIAGWSADRIVCVEVLPAETFRALKVRACAYYERFFSFEMVARKMAARLKAPPVFAASPAAHLALDHSGACKPERRVFLPTLAGLSVRANAQARAPPRLSTQNRNFMRLAG
jgi:hypothetical protein